MSLGVASTGVSILTAAFAPFFDGPPALRAPPRAISDFLKVRVSEVYSLVILHRVQNCRVCEIFRTECKIARCAQSFSISRGFGDVYLSRFSELSQTPKCSTVPTCGNAPGRGYPSPWSSLIITRTKITPPIWRGPMYFMRHRA